MIFNSQEAPRTPRPEEDPSKKANLEPENELVFTTTEDALEWFANNPVPPEILMIHNPATISNYLSNFLPDGGLIEESNTETELILRGTGSILDPSPNWRINVNKTTGKITVQNK